MPAWRTAKQRMHAAAAACIPGRAAPAGGPRARPTHLGAGAQHAAAAHDAALHARPVLQHAVRPNLHGSRGGQGAARQAGREQQGAACDGLSTLLTAICTPHPAACSNCCRLQPPRLTMVAAATCARWPSATLPATKFS